MSMVTWPRAKVITDVTERFGELPAGGVGDRGSDDEARDEDNYAADAG